MGAGRSPTQLDDVWGSSRGASTTPMSCPTEIGSCALPRAAAVDEGDSGGVPQVLPGPAGPPCDRSEAGGSSYRAEPGGCHLEERGRLCRRNGVGHHAFRPTRIARGGKHYGLIDTPTVMVAKMRGGPVDS